MPEILHRPTALPTSYLVDAIYEGVTGEERPSLLERNDLVRGAVETATNAVNYVGDTVTGNKSWEQIKSDAKSFGQGLYDDYIDPFAKDAQYDQDNLLKGGLWTRSEEQSYTKGQNEFKKDMVVAEVAVSALSAGTGTAAMRTVKLANKLDGPGGPKGLGGGRRKGIGGLLLGTVDDMMDGGASIFDGKMKTSAKTPGDKQAEIQAVVEKFQLKMKEQSNKEVDNRLDGGKGHTGSRAQEIQTEHAAKSLDIPNKNVLPKVVNGDSGHSNYSPSMNSKANSGNKNSSQGSNKPDTEARTGHAQHAEKPHDIPDEKDLPKVVNGDFGNSNHRSGNVRLRDNDTEYKILNDLASRLDKLPDPSKARGKIKLFTELDTCGSCSRIIEKFQKDYPNIDIEVIHNGDKIVQP
ncbi:deaminase domain-containing protein [Brevibacillus formosus]|uniref:deaminase domain-containing protein n=1 Tax=Brevibacillus formosus TaxID=54913 RepID=UPI001F549F8F|nr:deaminase domain-containing protein [Brevibacillus formosus]